MICVANSFHTCLRATPAGCRHSLPVWAAPTPHHCSRTRTQTTLMKTHTDKKTHTPDKQTHTHTHTHTHHTHRSSRIRKCCLVIPQLVSCWEKMQEELTGKEFCNMAGYVISCVAIRMQQRRTMRVCGKRTRVGWEIFYSVTCTASTPGSNFILTSSTQTCQCNTHRHL